MPGTDGYQVCRKIKENPKTKDILVIFTTVMEEDLQKNLGYSVGCADYITKPLETYEIKVKVKIHLSLVFYQKEIERLNHKIKELEGK